MFISDIEVIKMRKKSALDLFTAVDQVGLGIRADQVSRLASCPSSSSEDVQVFLSKATRRCVITICCD